jgi:integrase
LRSRSITVSEFFVEWDQSTPIKGMGWRICQRRTFHKYVLPVIGSMKLNAVTPAHIGAVLKRAQETGLAAGSLRKIYAIAHTVFGDAEDIFDYIPKSPVRRKLKPALVRMEAAYLEVQDLARLLGYVADKPYAEAIWLQAMVGLRAGEMISLRWDCVDLAKGILHVRRAYDRIDDIDRDWPKGKRWRTVRMPPELIDLLRRRKTPSLYVAPNESGSRLSYWTYCKALKAYCTKAQVPVIASHGLRHSTSELYMGAGATRDDVRVLMGHSSSAVTDLYVHDKGDRLAGYANVIRLFPQNASTMLPRNGENQGADEGEKDEQKSANV